MIFLRAALQVSAKGLKFSDQNEEGFDFFARGGGGDEGCEFSCAAFNLFREGFEDWGRKRGRVRVFVAWFSARNARRVRKNPTEPFDPAECADLVFLLWRRILKEKKDSEHLTRP